MDREAAADGGEWFEIAFGASRDVFRVSEGLRPELSGMISNDF